MPRRILWQSLYFIQAICLAVLLITVKTHQKSDLTMTPFAFSKILSLWHLSVTRIFFNLAFWCFIKIFVLIFGETGFESFT